MMMSCVHMPTLQKPWHVFQSALNHIDQHLRERSRQHVLHVLGGDFNVHLKLLDFGIGATEERGEDLLATLYQQSFEARAAEDAVASEPRLLHTYFPFCAQRSPSTLDYWAVHRPHWHKFAVAMSPATIVPHIMELVVSDHAMLCLDLHVSRCDGEPFVVPSDAFRVCKSWQLDVAKADRFLDKILYLPADLPLPHLCSSTVAAAKQCGKPRASRNSWRFQLDEDVAALQQAFRLATDRSNRRQLAKQLDLARRVARRLWKKRVALAASNGDRQALAVIKASSAGRGSWLHWDLRAHDEKPLLHGNLLPAIVDYFGSLFQHSRQDDDLDHTVQSKPLSLPWLDVDALDCSAYP